MVQENSDIAGLESEGHRRAFPACLVPGLGQFARHRWIAGIFYAGCFTACIVALALASNDLLEFCRDNMSDPNWKGYVEHGRLSWMIFRMLVFAVFALVVYVLSACDVVVSLKQAGAAGQE